MARQAHVTVAVEDVEVAVSHGGYLDTLVLLGVGICCFQTYSIGLVVSINAVVAMQKLSTH